MARKCFFCMSDIDDNEPVINLHAYCLCQKCATAMDEGIAFISVTNDQNFRHQESIVTMEDGKRLYPTGEWIVLPEELVIQIFSDDQSAHFIGLKKVFLLSEDFDIMKDKLGQIKLKNEENA